MENARYSLVVYYMEMLEDDIKNLKNKLREGITVHLFLTSTLSEWLENNGYDKKFFNIEKDNKLLFTYENQEEILGENLIVCSDNKVHNEYLYRKLCKSKKTEFNYHQYEIITALDNMNYIVVSGAGTGKTTTMISRLMYLRKTKADFTFDKAIMITFTNKASREMRERLVQVLERYYIVTKNPKYLDMMEEAIKCNISTMHSFSKKLINQYGKNIKINKNIQVKSFKYFRSKAITEALNFLYHNYGELYRTIKYYPHYEIESKLLEMWNKLDNYSIDLNTSKYKIDFGVDEEKFSQIVEIVLLKAQEILEREKDENIEVVDLMKKLSYNELFSDIKGKYDLIMVDEFQDSDNIQIDFVAKFCRATGSKLIVVGDEKQSIYRFRGAEYTAFHRLKEIMKYCDMKVKEFTMVRNYRTNSMLLRDINEIFVDVNKRVDRFVYEEKDHIYSLLNINTEKHIKYIDLPELDENAAKFYTDLLEKKDKNDYIAVLLRSNSDVKEFKKFCDRKSIPCRVDMSGGFYRHDAVRDFYIMIKALIDTNENALKYSFIETPYINKNIDKKIILIENRSIIKGYMEEILQKKNWTTYQNLIHEINILELIDKVILEINPIKEYYMREYLKAKENGREAEKVAKIKTLEYKLNLEHLIYIIKEKFSQNISSIADIEEFLRLKIATDDSMDIRKPSDVYEKDFIQCSTVHKAKGLEYDHVILPKLTKKFIASKNVDVIVRTNRDVVKVGFKVKLEDNEYKNSNYTMYLKDEKNEIIGEEARLLYVAMTRCKKSMYLNVSRVAATEGMNSWQNLIGGAKSYV